MAIIQTSGLLEEINERLEGDLDKDAILLNKLGLLQNYRGRMLQMRARGFALRDAFADVLKGFNIREEVEDYLREKALSP